MDQYELVRTGYRVYGKNISELARLTGHSRNTIKKAIRSEPWGYKERWAIMWPLSRTGWKTTGTSLQSSDIRHIGYTIDWWMSMAIKAVNRPFVDM